MKLTKRKAFKFFRSYYDVYNELQSDKDKIAFIEALLDKQFLGKDPTDLKGMAKFAYISQINSIDSQVTGYEAKTKTTLGGTQGGAQGGSVGGCLQEEEKEEEKEELTYRKFDHLSITVKDYNKLCNEWLNTQVDDVLDSIENYSKNKSYKSLYLTARKWLNKQYPKQPSEAKPETLEEEMKRKALENLKHF